MKQLLVFLFLLCAASVSAQDVIVKKDGSTIVCCVVELTSTEIVYKKWSDLNGSNYVMDRSDASAINYQNGRKENLLESMIGNNDSYSTNRYETNIPKFGIKGFVEGGYTIGAGLYGEQRVSFMATVGCQFNPYFFVGIGSGENYFGDSKLYGIPFFADIRLNLQKTSISPLLDLKIGYSIADVKGFFLSPSVGCRFGYSNNTAFTFSIGYELQKADCFTVITDLYSLNQVDYYQSKESVGGLTLKIGFEF